jgi:hypothetical protein
MGTRGRKRNAGIGIAPEHLRMDPPAGLSPAAQATWRQIVACRPADWWDHGSEPLLASYVVSIEALAKLNAARLRCDVTKKAGLTSYIRLSALADREAKLVMRLASAMRLSQGARRRLGRALPSSGKGVSDGTSPNP